MNDKAFYLGSSRTRTLDVLPLSPFTPPLVRGYKDGVSSTFSLHSIFSACILTGEDIQDCKYSEFLSNFSQSECILSLIIAL